MSVLFFLFAALASLAPSRDHHATATALATVILDEAPLFKGDDDRMRTAAFLVAVAYRESSLRNDAVGDHGKARCLFQLWAAPAEVLTDPVLCTRLAFPRLRESIRACGAGNELGMFAVGPRGCTSETAKRISRDRMHIARRLAKEIHP